MINNSGNSYKVYGDILYYFHNISVNLKLFLKIKFIKREKDITS